MSDSLKTLSTVARILQQSDPAENPLAHIVTLVRQEIGVDACSLYLLHEKTLILVATDGLNPISVGHVSMQLEEGLTGLAVEKLQPVFVNEPSLHPRFKFFPETEEERFRSFAAFPLLDRSRVVGVLTLQTFEPRAFDLNETAMLKLIAFQLAGVIHNLVTLEVLRRSEISRKKTRHLKGIPVAPGFGIGSAFFLRPGVSPVIVPPEHESTNPKQEWRALRKALRSTSEDLLNLENRLRDHFSKREADIFYSHRMILSDFTFQKKLKSEILGGKIAFETINTVIGDYIAEFEKLEDPHFRERSADLEDLRQRILGHLVGPKAQEDETVWEGVLTAETLVPSDTVKLDPTRIAGILTSKGGHTSHAAVLARSFGIPAIMGVAGLFLQITPGDLVVLDGNSGDILVNPTPAELAAYEKMQEAYAGQLLRLQKISAEPGITQDGHRVHLEANVGVFSDLKKLRFFGAEAVGLYRTEFPFLGRKQLPDEAEQMRLYQDVIGEADGLSVTFRILDAGGDKPVEALGSFEEDNPFLGYRSIRLSLAHPDVLKTQFRALLKVSVEGPIRVLIPMIAGLEELQAVRAIFDQEKRRLSEEGIAYAENIPFGIMIEVPSAVQMSDHLIEYVDFFSIGTNDLIQYTLAVDRNNERVAPFFEPLHPAILHSISQVVKSAKKAGKPVAVCGEMAGDPLMALVLIGMGIRDLSMNLSNIPKVKEAISKVRLADLEEIVRNLLSISTVQEIKNTLQPLKAMLAD